MHLLKLIHFLDFSYFFRKWWLATLCTAAALSTVFTAVRPSWMCSLAKLRDCCSHRHRLCCHFWTHWGCFVAKFIAFACFYQLRPLDPSECGTCWNTLHVGPSSDERLREKLFTGRKNLLQTHRNRVLCALLDV